MVSKRYIEGIHFRPLWKLFRAPLFVVPKPGVHKYRPIVHLSWNEHFTLLSINDLLCEYMKTIKYISFREVVRLVNNGGPGAYIFLIDAQDAYYRVPIHPNDWRYNGIQWANKLWVFTSLQMGLSSSPRIYTHFADAIEYICCKENKSLCFYKGLQMLRHYIDDFFAVCKSKSDAEKLFQILYKLFEELGVSTREDKCQKPQH